VGISFALESGSLTVKILYGTLLVVLPAIALTGLFTRAAWGRRAATLSLLCTWAFQLRTLVVWVGDEIFPVAFLRSPYYTAFILMLAGFIIGIPLLLLKLYRGETESNYFTKADAENQTLSSGNPLYIGDAVTDFDKGLFDRQADLFL
jgi:hypothetical protein